VQTGHDGDEVLQGAAEPVQGRDDQGVALAQVVQGLPEFFAFDVLAGLLVGEDPDAARLGQRGDLPVQNWSFVETAIPRAGDTW
jgi:hypothetical protein